MSRDCLQKVYTQKYSLGIWTQNLEASSTPHREICLEIPDTLDTTFHGSVLLLESPMPYWGVRDKVTNSGIDTAGYPGNTVKFWHFFPIK